MNEFSARVILTTALALATAACGGGSTSTLDPDEVAWVEYRHSRAGYRMSLPENLQTREEGDGVFCRFDGGVPVLVRLTSEEEARGTGAWFGHEPDGPVTLDGRRGQRFVYDHWDGPFAARTIAYVVPVGDRFLGLEFRTDADLDPVQERILASFRWQ